MRTHSSVDRPPGRSRSPGALDARVPVPRGAPTGGPRPGRPTSPDVRPPRADHDGGTGPTRTLRLPCRWRLTWTGEGPTPRLVRQPTPSEGGTPVELGIDLGTANTVVSDVRRGIVFDEPSVMLLRRGGGRRERGLARGRGAACPRRDRCTRQFDRPGAPGAHRGC